MEPLPTSSVRNRRRIKRFVLIAIAALLLLALLLVVLIPSESQLTWLTPAELAHATKPNELTIVKRKLINLTAPLWRWYRSNRRTIQIRSNFLTLSPAASEHIGLGAATTTNADGLRAWILSPAEFTALQQHLKTLAGASITASPTFQIADGNPAQVSVGRPFSGQGKFVPLGFSVNLIPHAAAHSVKLLLSASSTEIADPNATNNIMIRTNFIATCAAIVPDNGGLVLEGGRPDDTDMQSCWLIVSPTMFDSQGNPIKP